MKCNWEDLPRPLNAFTVRNAAMVNLNNGEVIRYYSANTKIVLAQKAITPKGTFYRTREAEHHFLNYAFEAASFGLPNEFAPPVPKMDPNKTKNVPTNSKAKGGEPSRVRIFFQKLLRRSS